MMKPAGLVATLAALLSAAVLHAAETTARFDKTLNAEQQAVHVLNRMTFGPRPGDVDAVRRMGVKKWISRQLEPARITQDPQLEQRLAAMSTQSLPTWQLIERYQPPPVMINMASMMPSLPGDTMLRLSSASTSLAERRTLLESLDADARAQALATIPQQLVEGIPEFRDEAERARQSRQTMIQRQLNEQQRRLRPPLTELLDPQQLNVLRHGGDDEKRELVRSMPQEKQDQLFRAMGPQGAQLLPSELRRRAALLANPQEGVLGELIEAKLHRAVHSERQLEEVLVDFWFNHFNVSATKAQVRMLLPSYEREAIRPHVLGKFRDMLLATARHPAMLFYLDNYQSQAQRREMLQVASLSGVPLRLPGVNENYARELMELHTLGVDGGYTQEDVGNVARILTGWTIHDVTRVGEFQFNPVVHDREEKTVLGQVFPRGGGENEGVQLIDLLARHPSTARFISRKLAQRFVADQPPAGLVERMAATFMKTDGDLKAVMETLLLSREFLSEGAWRSKVKSPLEMVVSSLRALDADLDDTAAVAKRIADLGQPLYSKAEPTGYPNTSDSWGSSVDLLGRMNFAIALLGGQIDGAKVEVPAAVGSELRRAMRTLTGVDASAAALAAVESGAIEGAPPPTLVATVLIGSPDFQKK